MLCCQMVPMSRRRGEVVIIAPLSITALGSSGDRWTSSTIVWARFSGGCFELGREVVDPEWSEWSDSEESGWGGSWVGVGMRA